MKAHDLARQLLAGPDIDVWVYTVNGYEVVEKIVTEDEQHTFHDLGEQDAEKYFPELKQYKDTVDSLSDEEYTRGKFPSYNGRIYDLFEEQNDSPGVILVSPSIGLH